MLKTHLALHGFPVEARASVADSPDELRDALQNCALADVIITVGGVSVGRLDFLRAASAEAGFVQQFWRVNQQPGGPLFFARRDSQVLFGLPGNPVSCYFCTDLYVLPHLRKLAGMPFAPIFSDAILDEPLRKSHGKAAFLRAGLTRSGGELHARTTGAQDSNLIHSLTTADGYIVFPAEKNELERGEHVSVLMA